MYPSKELLLKPKKWAERINTIFTSPETMVSGHLVSSSDRMRMRSVSKSPAPVENCSYLREQAGSGTRAIHERAEPRRQQIGQRCGYKQRLTPFASCAAGL
jgi:hypothetical protein